ncbi:choice-of-anchor I family protein [Paenibacillus tarimensis]|nr:choice-of-anchor I family protein [Paenibacillus tarimensis]
MKRWFSLGMAALLALQVLAGYHITAYAEGSSYPDHLIINQVYGGGGKSDTPITHSFIELYNPTDEPIDLSGWKVEYSSARSGSKHLGSTVGESVYTSLDGIVPAYTSYLIRGAAETTPDELVTVRVAQYDLDWPERYIDNDQYNIRVVNSESVPVDQLAVKEAGGEGSPVASISKQKSVRRTDFKDTNENAADFQVLEYKAGVADAAFIAANRPRSLADGAWGIAPEIPGPVPGGDTAVIKIFHTNDIHSRAKNGSGQIGFAQFKTFIDRESEGASGKIVLDAGDIFHGQTIATLERGASIAELVRAVGYTAISAGNHDFNYGWERLLELEELSGAAVLSANAVKDGGTPFNRAVIQEAGGVTFGIFGLSTPETAYKTNPKNVEGIDFGSDEQIIELSKEMVADLKAEGAQFIIALSHLGDDPLSTIKSTDIAQHVPGIDLIIDGHSHSNYPQGQRVNGVLIASAGEYFKNAGVVTVAYNKETNEKQLQARSIPASELTLEQYPEDPAVKAVYNAIIERQSAIKDVTIGTTPIKLDGVRDNVRSGETNLGRLITSAMLDESGAQIAITNGGGIRESITAGDITKGQVLDVLPFGNYIVTKSLTGAQIKAALEQGMTFGAGSFPHFAGMEVTVDKYTVMSGSTPVEKGRVTAVTVNGQPMSDTESYVVATNDFMAAGGDGYTVLAEPAVLNNFAALDEALISYISKADIAKLDAERRLHVKTEPKKISYLGSYSTGYQSEDGGVAEIVKYNPDNKKMYLVNGMEQKIDIVSLADVKSEEENTYKLDKRIDVTGMVPDFTFGDITSVDINTERNIVAVAVQEKDHTKPGAVLVLDYDGSLIHYIRVGVQPDMLAFTPDGQYILTANEGEPRAGYGEGAVDPKGSVSVIDLRHGVKSAEAVNVTFDAFDAKRDQLVADKVLLKKGAAPSVDLEPEYIAVDKNSRMAYVSLQEANAIAVLDIAKYRFTSVRGLGFKDHSQPGNELDLLKDGKAELKSQPVHGVYMPDGLAAAEIGGKTYLLTANEGDAREWGDYENIHSVEIDGRKVEMLKNEEHDGLEEGKQYVLGGRSFSIWDAETMELVYDSGSEFEKRTAELYPKYFNASNKNTKLDDRSGKKGPEPEDIKVLEAEGRLYAVAGLERIGGVMVYDITDPGKAAYYDYMNTRDYSAPIAGDVSPEGLAVVKAEDSPTRYPLILAAHEVSGTVAVYQLNKGYKDPAEQPGTPGNGDSGGSGGGSPGYMPSPSPRPEQMQDHLPWLYEQNKDVIVPLTPSPHQGVVRAVVAMDQLTKSQNLLADVTVPHGLEFRVEEAQDAGAYEVLFEEETASALFNMNLDHMSVNTQIGQMSFDKQSMSSLQRSLQGTISFNVSSVDAASLPQSVQQAVAGRPVVDFTVTTGGKAVTDFGGGTVQLSIPYTPAAGEDIQALVAYHVSGNGQLTAVNNGHYDAAAGRMVFKVKHFSTYAVGYNKVMFEDVSGWAADYISYLAARGIVDGIGNGKFAPGRAVTRAEMTVLLAKLSGADLTKYSTRLFSDVEADSWYALYTAWAAENGIVKGVGGSRFNPDGHITREELSVMLARYAEQAGLALPSDQEASAFADGSKISSWAADSVRSMQQAGIIEGQGSGMFNPKGQATRAEAAKMIAVLVQGMSR